MEERNINSLKSFIERSGDPITFSVETGAIKRYADAIGDTNPVFTDDSADGLIDGKLFAPPGFFGWPTSLKGNMPFYPQLRVDMIAALAKEGYTNLLDGSLDYEFFTPILAGDILYAVMTIKELSLKQGRSGYMVVCTLEFTYDRPNGERAAKVTQKIIAK